MRLKFIQKIMRLILIQKTFIIILSLLILVLSDLLFEFQIIFKIMRLLNEFNTLNFT